MITLREYLGKDHDNLIHFLDSPTQNNIDELLVKLNKFRAKLAKPMRVTSGYRTRQRHLEIYNKKGVLANKIPWGSLHLSGRACDFADADGTLKEWVKKNEDFVLNTCGLWAEHWSATPGWLHLQSAPYGSWTKGKSLWFMP